MERDLIIIILWFLTLVFLLWFLNLRFYEGLRAGSGEWGDVLRLCFLFFLFF